MLGSQGTNPPGQDTAGSNVLEDLGACLCSNHPPHPSVTYRHPLFKASSRAASSMKPSGIQISVSDKD